MYPVWEVMPKSISQRLPLLADPWLLLGASGMLAVDVGKPESTDSRSGLSLLSLGGEGGLYKWRLGDIGLTIHKTRKQTNQMGWIEISSLNTETTEKYNMRLLR